MGSDSSLHLGIAWKAGGNDSHWKAGIRRETRSDRTLATLDAAEDQGETRAAGHVKLPLASAEDKWTDRTAPRGKGSRHACPTDESVSNAPSTRREPPCATTTKSPAIM
jgi:hypothetical protein